MMKKIVGMFLLISALAAIPSMAFAQGLSDYKGQKHKKQAPKVTKQTCEQEYINRCEQQCTASAVSCSQQCKAEAPTFCKARTKRRRRKQAGVVAKGASVVAGGAVVMLAKRAEKNLPKGAAKPDEYTIYWKAPSAIAEVGVGYVFDNVAQFTGTTKLRYNWFGASAQVSHLRDSETDLTETDLGPTFYMSSLGFGLTFGLQPSLLISSASDVDTLYGVGVRSYTDLHLRRLVLSFEPMLGYINRQWNYHMRLGGAYRITPRIFVKAVYDYRDIVDLNDLDISQARLQGITGMLGFRFN